MIIYNAILMLHTIFNKSYKEDKTMTNNNEKVRFDDFAAKFDTVQDAILAVIIGCIILAVL